MGQRTVFALILLGVLSSQLLAQEKASAQQPASAAVQPIFGEKLHLAGIHNAGKIHEVLFRGAQPKENGLAELKKLGITTIVDLRGEDREKSEWERGAAETLGMRFVHLPVSGWAPPSDEQVAQFLALFRDDPQQKVFVHCRFGDDRTGVFVAAYRMAVDQWSPEQAIEEMYFFGFNGFWHPSMKKFIREFPHRRHPATVLSPPGQAGSNGSGGRGLGTTGDLYFLG
ncbi:MAG TPA: tyrosine-protein phosphatase [Candidatus Acidoferrum sp.]